MKNLLNLLAHGDIKTIVSMGYVYEETFLFDAEDNFGKDLTVYHTTSDNYDFIVDFKEIKVSERLDCFNLLRNFNLLFTDEESATKLLNIILENYNKE